MLSIVGCDTQYKCCVRCRPLRLPSGHTTQKLRHGVILTSSWRYHCAVSPLGCYNYSEVTVLFADGLVTFLAWWLYWARVSAKIMLISWCQYQLDWCQMFLKVIYFVKLLKYYPLQQTRFQRLYWTKSLIQSIPILWSSLKNECSPAAFLPQTPPFQLITMTSLERHGVFMLTTNYQTSALLALYEGNPPQRAWNAESTSMSWCGQLVQSFHFRTADITGTSRIRQTSQWQKQPTSGHRSLTPAMFYLPRRPVASFQTCTEVPESQAHSDAVGPSGLRHRKRQFGATATVRIRKRKCRRFDEICVIGCTVRHQIDNFHYSQWRKSRQNDNISAPANKLILYVLNWFNSLAPGDLNEFLVILANFSNWYLRYLLWNCSQMNATGPYWW